GGATGADPFMGSGAPEVRKATLTLNLTPRSERGGVKKQVIEQQLRDALVAVPGARINVGFGGSNEKYTLVLAGEDGSLLADAALAIDSGPAKIDRYDRLRNINFDIELNGQPLGAVQAEALALPSIRNLPPGVQQTTVGDAEAMTELFDSFGLAMLTGVACIY